MWDCTSPISPTLLALPRYPSALQHGEETTLAFEGAGHGDGVIRDNRQKHLRRLVGTMSALLPIPDGAERQMEPRGKLLLRHIQLLAQGADGRYTASAGKLRRGRWRTIG